MKMLVFRNIALIRRFASVIFTCNCLPVAFPAGRLCALRWGHRRDLRRVVVTSTCIAINHNLDFQGPRNNRGPDS